MEIVMVEFGEIIGRNGEANMGGYLVILKI